MVEAGRYRLDRWYQVRDPAAFLPLLKYSWPRVAIHCLRGAFICAQSA